MANPARQLLELEVECMAYGSSSLVRLMSLHGLADRAVEVEPYGVYEPGPFEVSFVPSHRGVGYFLAGVAGRDFTEDHWRRVPPRLDPRIVVPTHYDNLFTPLGEPMETIGNTRVSELPEEIGAVSADARVAALRRADLRPAPPDG